jgi:hypothetical protein
MLLAVIAAVSLQARVADVRLFSADSHSALQMTLTGVPERVVVRRDGDLTRVSLTRTDLGLAFSGGARFQWLWTSGFGAGSRRAHCPEALWIERGRGEVTVSLRLAPQISVESRQVERGVLLVFREPRVEATGVIQAEATSSAPVPPSPSPPPPPPPPPMPTPTLAPTEPEQELATPPPATPTPAATPGDPSTASEVAQLLNTLPPPTTAEAPAVNADVATEPPPQPSEPTTPDLTAQLLGTLSPPDAPSPAVASNDLGTGTGEDPAPEVDSESLYRRLFPHDVPPLGTVESPPVGGTETHPERSFELGIFTLTPTLRVSYMDATASLLDDTDTVRDRYLELRPGLAVGSDVGAGRFQAEYEPAFRTFASFAPTRSTSHRAGASLNLTSGGAFGLVIRDAWAAGVLEAQEVDPGGEYFFDLQRFWRNTLGITARHEVAPRWTLQAGGRLNQVRFRTPGAFFDHDTWTLDLRVDHDIAENLRASLAYVHDRVPETAERPQAESTANTVQAVLTGQATPFVSAEAMLGYREQEHPFAGEGGRRYRGLVIGGSVSRTLGLASSVSLSATRTALLSSFEDNGFYVTNHLQTAAVVRLPYGLFLDGAVGYRWNDYETIAREIGAPRDDSIFEWGIGIRRPVGSGSIGTSYQRQRRRSNIDRFDTSTDRLMLQFDFDVLRATGLR